MCSRRFLKYLFYFGVLLTILIWNNYYKCLYGSDYRKYLDIKNNKYKSETMKYILFWTPWEDDSYSYFGEGAKSFEKYNCPITDCYVTSDRKLRNLTDFDAIIFKWKAIFRSNSTNLVLPEQRSDHQKYVFYEIESADNYPICNNSFANYFNWTMTYMLHSDIVYRYFIIKDTNGTIIGPGKYIDWIPYNNLVNKSFVKTKKKAVAWFVSNCVIQRLLFAIKLQYALRRYNLVLDIYGDCGYLTCNKSDIKCLQMLRDDYYFYLAFENSNADDYVTEKILMAMQNHIVPIVLGGADYSDFLPPESYIDARAYSSKSLAAYINDLILNPDLYLSFFKWKSYYTYHDPLKENLCSICEALYDKEKLKHSVYSDIKKWWNSKYEDSCLHYNKIKLDLKKLSMKRNKNKTKYLFTEATTEPWVSAFQTDELTFSKTNRIIYL